MLVDGPLEGQSTSSENTAAQPPKCSCSMHPCQARTPQLCTRSADPPLRNAAEHHRAHRTHTAAPLLAFVQQCTCAAVSHPWGSKAGDGAAGCIQCSRAPLQAQVTAGACEGITCRNGTAMTRAALRSPSRVSLRQRCAVPLRDHLLWWAPIATCRFTRALSSGMRSNHSAHLSLVLSSGCGAGHSP